MKDYELDWDADVRYAAWEVAMRDAEIEELKTKLDRIQKLVDEQNRAMPAYLLTSQLRSILDDE